MKLDFLKRVGQNVVVLLIFPKSRQKTFPFITANMDKRIAKRAIHIVPDPRNQRSDKKDREKKKKKVKK